MNIEIKEIEMIIAELTKRKDRIEKQTDFLEGVSPQFVASAIYVDIITTLGELVHGEKTTGD